MPRLYFLKQKKIGGSKEVDELKRNLESKSLLELLGMMDDVGKQKVANSLKSVDPQQSLGISHLGLDGYLRKAFELLERGFPHMEGSGMTPDEKAELVRLEQLENDKAVMSPEGRVRLRALQKKEDDDEIAELDITSEYYGILSDKIKAEMVTSAAIDKLDIIKRNFSVETPIAAAVEQLGNLADLKHILNYRRADTYAPKRSDIHKIPYASTSFASDILTLPSDYDQYVENEAVKPLSNLLREKYGENITSEQIEKSPNILRYLGANVERYGEPHTTDPIDIVVIPSSDSKKIYAVEVKGRNRGEDYKKKPPTVGMNKFYYFNELRKKYPRKEVVPIVMWPNVPNTLVTGKYYTHIPSYSYVIDPEVARDPHGTKYFTYTYDPKSKRTKKEYVDKPNDIVESRQDQEIFKEYPKKMLSKVKNPRHTATEVVKSAVEQHRATAAELERNRPFVSQLPKRRATSVAPPTTSMLPATMSNAVAVSLAHADDSKEPEIERESKDEPETQAERLVRMFNNMGGVIGGPGKQQEYTNAYNRFLQEKGLPAVKKETIQGYISKKLFPDKAVKEGLYAYFLTPTETKKKKKKPTAAEKRAAKKAEDKLLVAAIAEVDKKKEEEEEKRKDARANVNAMYERLMAKKAALKK